MNKVKNFVAGIVVSTLGVLSADADDIYKGVISQTNWQYDQRVSYGEKELNRTTTATMGSNSILKYWNGNTKGIFGFVNVPWKSLDTETVHSSGIGDVTLGLGPRGRFDVRDTGSFHWISYAGAIVPTGNNTTKPALGNGRTDFKTGCFATYLTLDKKFEVDTSIEYTPTFTSQISHELATGFVIGGALPHNFRVAAGLTSVLKHGSTSDKAYSVNYRMILRKNFSPTWHLVAIGDIGIKSEGMPCGFGMTLIARYNLK